jgi:hypothetical protein
MTWVLQVPRLPWFYRYTRTFHRCPFCMGVVWIKTAMKLGIHPRTYYAMKRFLYRSPRVETFTLKGALLLTAWQYAQQMRPWLRANCGCPRDTYTRRLGWRIKPWRPSHSPARTGAV